ncbi:cytochrome P450 94A1 [Carex littledalei]|uniref:Cytochrome P450 94A1 n=1 Tax=Carex littledalei TaxID=544730 RepID=A0A833QR49_9POAL|nr:cytochrome P450 94A1 [Carex littledalei]
MNLSITVQSLFIGLLFSFLLYLYSKNQRSIKKPTIHGLKSYPVIGHLPHFIRNSHRILDWTTEILLQSPTHTMGLSTIGSISGIFTANPANVEHMLKLNSINYPKGEKAISIMEDFLGHGLFNSDDEDWKWQRKTASYEFNKKSMRHFVVETVHWEISNRLLPILNQAAEKGVKIDLQDVVERFAFDNICRVVFGEDPACLTEEGFSGTSSIKDFLAALSDAQDFSAARLLVPFENVWRIKKFLNIGTEKRLKKALSIVHGYTMNIIRSRMMKGMELDGREDMLSRFASNKDHNEVMLRDVVTNFLIAGRETTSAALTWVLWLVSTRPDIERKILDEIKFVRTSNSIASETFNFDDLRDMNYLHATITESMRLYPVVPLEKVSCKEDDVMPDGTVVGKGWFVWYSAYAMGRLEDIWGKDCMELKPERWLDENGVFKPESPFRYPVFHAGPRMCLGKEMAYIQMKSIVACVLERFQIRVLGKDGIPEYLLSFTLKMKDGLPVQLTKRED